MLLAAVTAAAAALAPLAARAAVLEDVGTAPAGWSDVGPASPNASLALTVALVRQKVDSLESRLVAMSTPGSADYGAFLTRAAVEAGYAPAPDAVAAVVDWLAGCPVAQHAVDGAFVDVSLDVQTANKLLSASYHVFRNAATGETKLRTLQYSVPDDVEAHVQLVLPSTYFGSLQSFRAVPRSAPAPARRGASSAMDSRCEQSVTPSCLKQMYNVADYAPDAGSGSRVSFASFLGQSAIDADLALYEQQFGIPPQGLGVELIAGATNDQNASLQDMSEADLDVQTLIGVAHPLPVTEFSTGGSP